MLIDTHCHLDAPEFDHDRAEMVQAALQAGVGIIVVPAVVRSNFVAVQELAARYPGCAMALGIHPLFVEQSQPQDLEILAGEIARNRDEVVAVGEIGLDFFVEHYDRERQEFYFVEQLKLAREYDLPVLLHVRRSVDQVLKQVRRFKVRGIAHAFNGSLQQAQEFIKLGFKLGFGGAMTYDRALKIRHLARALPLEAIVLETDAPDIPPSWLGHRGRNQPDQLVRIAQVLAEIRYEDVESVMEKTTQNALDILPGLANLYTPPQVIL
ncbi:TatD family hydrolase [Methylobacillus flagellatus]|uniref:TatD family hydrolase n=1 Tax=Methylobacillus flagellatus TaxID=405 RepID=UPI0028539E81|nr:TatD family hydrolase [Methylobacillus flagellatus]MDR5172534.1 TatD family hydrolase [Methylobacillus flagellatus]